VMADSLSSSRPITNLLTGVSQLSWSRDDTQLIFSGFEDGGYDIYTLENPEQLIDEDIPITPAKWISDRHVPKPELLIRDAQKDRIQSSVSYENYVFSNYDFEPETSKPEVELTKSETQDTSGVFHKYKYKTRFTLDLIQPYYDYSTQYSPQMMAFFLWSDILGDHRIYLGTEMDNISLKNSDYFFMYRYLPNRTDLNFLFSHNAALDIWQFTSPTQIDNLIFGAGNYVIRSRKLSTELLASRPFSRFQRLEYGLEYAYAEQAIFYNVETDDGYTESREKVISALTANIPTVGMVWDNTRWSYMYPIDGDRIYFRLQTSPRWGNNELFFHTMTMDARHYIPLGNGISFAGRMYAGFSGGRNAEKFRVGGLPWLFSSEDSYYAPGESPTIDNENNYFKEMLKEIFFTKYVTPVRGTQISELSGNKAVVVNLELRLPFLIYYFPSIKYLGQINGVLFTDFGMAWSDKRPDMWVGENWNSDPNEFVLTYGFGPRFIFLGMPWQLDYAWEYHPYKKPVRMWYLTIGMDF
ncbi:MAG: BamA/TamA family outer membrane protein, partial [Fidelibacterota bacterium]